MLPHRDGGERGELGDGGRCRPMGKLGPLRGVPLEPTSCACPTAMPNSLRARWIRPGAVAVRRVARGSRPSRGEHRRERRHPGAAPREIPRKKLTGGPSHCNKGRAADQRERRAAPPRGRPSGSNATGGASCCPSLAWPDRRSTTRGIIRRPSAGKTAGLRAALRRQFVASGMPIGGAIR